MLDVDKLTLLREVAVHGGISAAAQALRTTPSNVSQQLRRLEGALGIALLEARGRGVRLTPAAEALVRRTEDVLAILEEAEAELAEQRTGRGGGPSGAREVRLVGFHSFAVGLLGDVVARLGRSAPGLRLVFEEREPEGALAEVLARRADIAVVDEYAGYPRPPAAGIVRIGIGHEPVVPYLPAGSGAAAELDWAMEPESSDAARWALGLCRSAGFEPRVRYVSPDPSVHRRLLELGLAAAFLPATAAAGLPRRVRAAPDLPGGLHREHALVLRRGTERSAANTACRAAIAAAFGAAIAAHDAV
ncbi:LysR family transcriptional regulator [Leucobacter allii]|uniref:LysR family transcriptional regulator n=1 Tax=Leucobacter allii TaxID=2932247 RepID=UPI001FD149AA|nr:LysR family transcriptional regulator [Leucobacter allii]UOR01387.1 LysR family transcriptional regulator [Leucobacter allii]